jgi:hypothetical protein
MMPTAEYASMCSKAIFFKKEYASQLYDYVSVFASQDKKSIYYIIIEKSIICSHGRDVCASAPIHPRKMQRFS